MMLIHHRSRAESFASGMKFLSDDLDTYAAAVALLAVHGAISLTDAVLIGYSGRRSKEQDHRAASALLEKLCHARRVDGSGLKHLVWLLARKTNFAYGDRRVDRSEVKAAVLMAERFQAWVYRTFPEVAREDQSSP
ncbi:MAG TPA: hypothetical protein VGI81_07580 [Tepidisphaeraceae bacterium]